LGAKKVEPLFLNKYLWTPMVRNEDPTKLAERLDKAIALQPENAREDRFYRHTLACAYAICGDPYSAAEILGEIAHNGPDDAEELLRGLIFQQLDMPEAAKNAFELCIELDPYSDSAVIAKHRLAKM
jgi:regulator of sirC expression with transglutaminase-like and TPR domain